MSVLVLKDILFLLAQIFNRRDKIRKFCMKKMKKYEEDDEVYIKGN